jgi:hypothetical protein
MPDCATQTFTNFSQERFNCLVMKAQAAGITISGNQGTGSKDGFTIRWNFDPLKRSLELQSLGSHIFFPCGFINQQIHNLVDQCPES